MPSFKCITGDIISTKPIPVSGVQEGGLAGQAGREEDPAGDLHRAAKDQEGEGGGGGEEVLLQSLHS